jgi:hypothetical protein
VIICANEEPIAVPSEEVIINIKRCKVVDLIFEHASWVIEIISVI